MNVLNDMPPPASAIDIVQSDGFNLNNGIEIRDNNGVFIIHNEAFTWTAKSATHVDRGVLEFDDEVWGVLEVVRPKPDLLIIGTGKRAMPLSTKTKSFVHDLGIRIDIMDTHNAASYYNLLATERPGENIAVAMLSAGTSFR